MTAGLDARIRFGEFPERKHDFAESFLRQVVKEIALVFAGIQSPQQLMAATVTAMTDAGVVPCGNSWKIALP